MNDKNIMQELRQREMIIFSAIPGMNELLQAKPDEISEIQIKFPDAAFALHTANNLFFHDREMSLIAQRAYFSILNGERISDVRFKYERETDEYWKRHSWDD